MKLKKAIIGVLVVFALAVLGNYAVKSVFPLKYGETIDRYADKFDLSEELLMGVIYAESGFDPANIHRVDSLDDSTKLLHTIVQPGDTVLYENDLPDHYQEA